MIEHDDYCVEMMRAIIEPLVPAMTEELAQQEANADYFTERQEMMMGGNYE